MSQQLIGPPLNPGPGASKTRPVLCWSCRPRPHPAVLPGWSSETRRTFFFFNTTFASFVFDFQVVLNLFVSYKVLYMKCLCTAAPPPPKRKQQTKTNHSYCNGLQTWTQDPGPVHYEEQEQGLMNSKSKVFSVESDSGSCVDQDPEFWSSWAQHLEIHIFKRCLFFKLILVLKATGSWRRGGRTGPRIVLISHMKKRNRSKVSFRSVCKLCADWLQQSEADYTCA